MKYTKQYKNETAYNADNTRVKPNVSYLTEDENASVVSMMSTVLAEDEGTSGYTCL